MFENKITGGITLSIRNIFVFIMMVLYHTIGLKHVSTFKSLLIQMLYFNGYNRRMCYNNLDLWGVLSEHIEFYINYVENLQKQLEF